MTPRQSRILALSLLLLLIALIVAIITVPVFWLHRHYGQAIEQQSDLLARYSRIGATGPELTRQLKDLQTKGVRSFFLKNSAPALAASEIQEVVKNVVESHGGKIASMQIPGHKDDGNYRKVMVNIQMNATVSAAQKIFYALETQRPYFFLDNVSIRPAMMWQPPRGANVPGPEPEYTMQFEVAGYSIVEAK